MTKLMTAVAAMQCVEQGKLDLDKDVRPLLPEIGRYGIMTGFEDEKNLGSFEDNSTPITLRMLLCHTSGHEYDWFNPLLGKWRASRNEVPWSGPLLTDKCAIPLVFTPGTNFAYGASSDWAGRLVEIASGMTLEEYMHKYIVSLTFHIQTVESLSQLFVKTPKMVRPMRLTMYSVQRVGYLLVHIVGK